MEVNAQGQVDRLVPYGAAVTYLDEQGTKGTGSDRPGPGAAIARPGPRRSRRR